MVKWAVYSVWSLVQYVVKCSNLADWTMNRLRTCRINYRPHPPYIHLPGFPFFSLLFCFHILLSAQTKERKKGRPENEARNYHYVVRLSGTWALNLLLHLVHCRVKYCVQLVQMKSELVKRRKGTQYNINSLQAASLTSAAAPWLNLCMSMSPVLDRSQCRNLVSSYPLVVFMLARWTRVPSSAASRVPRVLPSMQQKAAWGGAWEWGYSRALVPRLLH